MNIFEYAFRNKLRFQTSRGAITTEDLFNLPLTSNTKVNLDAIAKQLRKELRDTEDESFVTPQASSTDLQVKFDIVKYIITLRLKERDEATAAKDKAAKKEKILEILARKQDAALEGKSEAELLAELENL